MKKTIKYLQNGEYHYATVKDVGDIDLLKTSNKDDLVSAINEIIVNGVSGGDGISQDQLDKINTDILGVSADIAAKYSELQGKISDGDAMQASLRAQAIKDINGAIAAANAAIEEYKKANEEAVKATQADIDAQNDRIDRINEQADALRTDLATAQTDLTQTKTDLSNAQLDFGKVRKSVVNLENEISTKLSNTDLDPLNQKIQSVESNVKQTKDELSQYVKHDEYDLTTGEVNKIKSNVKQLADRVETKVSRDTLNDDINEFVVKKANLLVQTRDWSIIDDVGWTFSNDGLIAIQAELYDHAHVLELHQTGVYAEQTVKGLHGGQSYTVSVSAKIEDAASGVNITLVGNNKTLGIMRRVKTHDTNISTGYERYEYTLVAPSDTLVLRFIATGMASSNVLYLYKAKLEEGTKSYEWEMNVNDIYAKVEKNSATLTTYDDRITGVVTKQRDFGTWKEQAQSTLTQTAEGLELNNQKLKSVDGDVVDVIQSKIDASAEKLTSNYEKFTNQQVGMIVDEGTNQILNSAFTYYDLDSKDVKKRSYTFDSWQNISAKATIKSINKVNWAHMAQSGLSNDNPISITSNAFPVKQGKVIVGVDVLTPNVRAIDNQKVLVLQFYDDDGTRVDYREVSLHDLGLDTIQSNVSKRGKYRVGIDRKDVTKMTVLARLPRNGEINFTNFFAKVSSLDNGDYQPNPADLQQQTIKQQTAIEQTADTIRLKADQTTVDTLNGTVKRQGTLIEQNAQHIQLKADGTTVTALSNKTDKLSQLVSKHSASLEVTDKAITQQASAISSVTTIANGANIKIDNLSFGGRNLLDNTDPTAFQKQNWNVFGQWWYGSGGNGTCTIETLNDSKYTAKHYFRIVGNTGGNRDFQQNFVPEDTTYTFSVKIRLYKDTNVYNPTILIRNFAQKDGIERNRYRTSVEGLSKDYWTDFSVTFSAHDIATVGGTASMQFGIAGTGSVEFLEPQLEKGSRPSDYSLSQNDLQRLASEDTASQISRLKADLPTTIVSTVTTTTNAEQIVNSSGIYSKVTKLVDTKVGGVTTQLETYKRTVDDTGNKLRDVMGALKLDSNGNLTSNFNELIKTASGVEERYTQLNSKIDGIVVGGKNLLDNSDGQLIMGYGIDNTTWTNGKATLVYNHNYSKTNKSSEILPQTGSRNQRYRVNKDEELTQSIIVETDATYNPNGVYQFTWFTAEFGHRLITANIDVLGTNKYRLWCSFKWDKDQSCNMRIMDIKNLTRVLQINTSGTYISFYHPQIERGNKPSDWGMSDNDINQKVDAAKSNLTQYVSQQITDAKQKMTEYTNNKTKDISTIKQTADKVSISVGKMFGKADASSLDVDANGIKLRSDLIQLGTSDSYQNMVTVDPYDDKTTIPSSFYGGTAIDYRQADGETRGIKKANVNNDYIPLSTHQPLAGIHPQDKIYFKMKFGNYNTSNCGYSLELWVYDGATYRGKHVLASTSASSAGAIPARNWERIEGWWVAPSNLFYGAGNPRYVLAISGTKGFDIEVLRPRVSRSQMTDIRLDGDVTIAPGFQLKADYIKSGTLNTNNLIMKHPQGSTVTFTQDGFDVQKSDNREAFYTIGGDGIDFWRMSASEAMNDYPAHLKPGYVHLGSLVALDNCYTKSTRRVDRLQQGIQQNKVSNDNGIGFIIDVTGGSDTFSILQKGAEYRNGDRSGRINFNDTVNNSHFPIWEVNATGFRSLSYPQSGYMYGRGILHYTNTYFFTDPVMGNEHNQSGGVNYHPSQRLGFVGNNGWGDFAITADNNNTMAVGAGSHNQNVWVNGFIFGSQNGADRIFGYDGNQWVDFVNKRTTRDNNDLTNHFASLHLWELQYSVLTHTSQLSKKTDIEPLDTKDFASKILSIDLYKYRYKTQDKNEKDNYGAIIDDVNEVKQYNLPQEFITTRDKGINDSHLITGLIATVQEQAKQIEQLSFRILELERGASING